MWFAVVKQNTNWGSFRGGRPFIIYEYIPRPIGACYTVSTQNMFTELAVHYTLKYEEYINIKHSTYSLIVG